MKLVIVWKTANEIDINNFVVPYAYNSKKQGWFDDVEVLIWGASQEVVVNNSIVKQRVSNLVKNEISVFACKMCADNVNATEVLESIGVKVFYTGQYLTEQIKDKDTEVIYL